MIENTISRNDIKIIVTSDVDDEQTKKSVEKTHKTLENTQSSSITRIVQTEIHSKSDRKRTKLWYELKRNTKLR